VGVGGGGLPHEDGGRCREGVTNGHGTSKGETNHPRGSATGGVCGRCRRVKGVCRRLFVSKEATFLAMRGWGGWGRALAWPGGELLSEGMVGPCEREDLGRGVGVDRLRGPPAATGVAVQRQGGVPNGPHILQGPGAAVSPLSCTQRNPPADPWLFRPLVRPSSCTIAAISASGTLVGPPDAERDHANHSGRGDR